MKETTAHLANLLYFTDNPTATENQSPLAFQTNAALIVNHSGKILSCGTLPDDYPGTIIDHRPGLLTPGFIDAHLHFPQLRMLGAHGETLLGWLNRYTFPQEAVYADPETARTDAQLFWKLVAANGITASAVFSSKHKLATDILFQTAAENGQRAIIGKVLMDQNVPDILQDTPQTAVEESVGLYQQWHGYDDNLLQYAFTPRFVPTCSAELLAALSEAIALYPNAYLHSHLSENRDEIAWVQELFPDIPSYTQVYHHFRLLHDKTIMAHGIHLCEQERNLLSKQGVCIAHCPLSNTFLGSGLFELDKMEQAGVKVCLGSDIAGGNSISPFRVMEEAYKVQQLRGNPVNPLTLWYMATTGAAENLGLSQTGRLEAGFDADFILLAPEKSPEIQLRFPELPQQYPEDIQDLISAMIFTGTPAMVSAVYTRGKQIYPMAK